MKSTPVRTAILLAVGVLFISGSVDAAIVYQQPDATTDITSIATDPAGSFAGHLMFFTPSQAGYLDEVEVSYRTVVTGGTGTIFTASIKCVIEQTSTSSPCAGHSASAVPFFDTSDTVAQGAQTTVTMEYASSTPYLLEAGKTYLLYVGCIVGGNGHAGADCDVSGTLQQIIAYGITSPQTCPLISANNRYCSGSPYLYVRTTDADIPQNFTNSYIIQENSPDQSEVTDTTTVTFDFDYWNTGYEGFDKAGIALSNLTAGQNVVVPEDDITLTGEGSYTQNMTLIEGHAYLYRAYLRNASTSERVLGRSIIFHVVENQGGQSIIPSLDENNATTTFSSTFGGFLGAVDLLETKFPFNWFLETIAIFSTLDETEEDQAQLTLDFSSVSSSTDQLLGGHPITFFSTSTVSHFMPAGFMTTIRLFIAGTLYFGLAANIFFTVRRRFA